ncbi:ABC transporter ATP-binding protein [Bradyrhizobium canariense]|uniref:Putative spermidine/putrescine transport system ATP-binding protein n=1 Tax=Bradyrhizobium canariense TaxID=255045 RepID=A0A1H1XMQ9_9BRAD|nr:ABC transporter ATP-binding protein [Bradyrhizobium canariense]SDT10109.1 putative spermidine/putrescine transport system ATP-binding protein [Bradyrhizobium canariense]
MDAIRASPLLRNRGSEAFRKMWRSSEPGPCADDVALDQGSVTEPRQQPSEMKLHVRGISKSYGTSMVLKPLELKVFAGELLAILGPSGSGKTTLLQIICGLVEPSGGRLMIDGNDETDNPADKRDIGVVFQNYALFPHLTVRENVAFPLQMRRTSKGEIRARVEAALAMVGLSNFAERFPLELSGGQQQRVALARCFVYRPSLILMDESLSALDKKLRDSMRIEIKRLHRETGATIIFVTHDQEEALALSDRICLMNDGYIEQLGTPEDIYERPANTFVADFIGASNLIFGTITADGRIESAEGALPLPANCAARAGQQVALLVRPEKLLLCNSDDGTLSGRVEESIYAGAETRLLVRLSGGTLMTVRRATGLPPVAIGERVFMCWDQNQARLLEGRTTAAVV